MKGENEMSVIPNTYVKYNSYIADANGDHRKVSTWTHADTVEMPDGTPLSNYSFEDTKVTQTESNDAQYYEVLFSESSAGSGTKTESAKKNAKFKVNPANNRAYIDGRTDGVGYYTEYSTGGVYVKNQTSASGMNNTKYMRVSYNDIEMGGIDQTWDGEHFSLKDTIASIKPTELISTLIAGQTTLTLQNVAITTTATYDFFTDVFGVSPTDIQVTNGEMVLTFEAQQSDVSVKVRVS